MHYVCKPHFFHTIHPYMFQPPRGHPKVSTDTLCEQGQQNTCLGVNIRFKNNVIESASIGSVNSAACLRLLTESAARGSTIQ
jgi:hypothetical protein